MKISENIKTNALTSAGKKLTNIIMICLKVSGMKKLFNLFLTLLPSKIRTVDMICNNNSKEFHNRMTDNTMPESTKKMTDKREMIKLLLAGKLGNTLRQWNDYDSLLRSDYLGPVTIRCKTANSRFCKYGVPQDRALPHYKRSIIRQIKEWLQFDNADPESFYFNESAPDDKLLFQGEFVKRNREDVLYYSALKLPMREALAKNGNHLIGKGVNQMFQKYMTSESYADFIFIHQMYQTAVIEFSVFEEPLGVRRNRNTIVWEVRDY